MACAPLNTCLNYSKITRLMSKHIVNLCSCMREWGLEGKHTAVMTITHEESAPPADTPNAKPLEYSTGELRLHEKIDESIGPSQLDPERILQAELVGREEEISLMQRAFKQAHNGQQRVVFISGEPGIGKTR